MAPHSSPEIPLHIFISNQSLTLTVAALTVRLNGQQLFHRDMAVGTQHTWERVATAVTRGEHSLVVSEGNTQTQTTEEITVERELWIVVTFQSPPPRLQVTVFDHPVTFM